jgi:ureidoglycolate hydrolase
MGVIEPSLRPNVPEHLVEPGASFAQSYQPVLDFDGWKVAMLRYFDATAPESFYRVERHWNTNEVFILTAGQAYLIIFDGDAEPAEPYYVIPMVHNVAYNVLRSVWHHAVMSPDAHIILVERSETGLATTDYAELAPATVEEIRRQFAFGAG